MEQDKLAMRAVMGNCHQGESEAEARERTVSWANCLERTSTALILRHMAMAHNMATVAIHSKRTSNMAFLTKRTSNMASSTKRTSNMAFLTKRTSNMALLTKCTRNMATRSMDTAVAMAAGTVEGTRSSSNQEEGAWARWGLVLLVWGVGLLVVHCWPMHLMVVAMEGVMMEGAAETSRGQSTSMKSTRNRDCLQDG
jgi:hypothetical protein